MKFTKQAITLLLALGATSQTTQAATVWTAQLISTTSTELASGTRTDLYNLHIMVDETNLNPAYGSELTVTDIYLDHLGGVPAIDPAALLMTSSAMLANTDVLDYYFTNNDLVNNPVFLAAFDSLGFGWASFATSQGSLRSVSDPSTVSLSCDFGGEDCYFDGLIQGTTLDNGDGVFTDVFLERLMQDPAAPNPPIGSTSIINWNATAVSAVPVPAAVWLFGSGLIGLFGVARRKSRS